MNEVAFETARVVSMAAFFFYGWSCIATDSMVQEFERYGLAGLRRLTGSLELAGALGLLASYLLPQLVPLASAGLSLLMLMGVATRIRIRDPWTAILPALVLLLMNAYIFAFSIRGAGA